jgi:hypothetical protein
MDEQARPVTVGTDRDAAVSADVCAKLSQKVYMRASVDANRTYVSGRALEAVVPSVFVDGLTKRCEELSSREQTLLEQLFLVGGRSNYTALLPADDHPGSRLRAWQCFYELEMDAAETYVSRFFGCTDFCTVEGFPQVGPDDDIVIIGSQVANASARTLLGEPRRKAPLFQIAHSGWRTELTWNLHTPEHAPRTIVTDFRGRRESVAHVIYERGNPVAYGSLRDLTGARYLDDYLLVTTLPRYRGRRQRVLILAGLHGPGSRAVDLILREPPADELAKAARQIAGAPFFQVLFHVDTVLDEEGECRPRHPELVDARALVVD